LTYKLDVWHTGLPSVRYQGHEVKVKVTVVIKNKMQVVCQGSLIAYGFAVQLTAADVLNNLCLFFFSRVASYHPSEEHPRQSGFGLLEMQIGIGFCGG